MVKKKKGTPNNPRRDIPREHHVARYCNPQRVDRDPETLAIRGVFPQAFALRPEISEEYLSLRHFEYFGADIDQQYKSVVAAFESAIKNVRPTSAVARVKCGDWLRVGDERGHKLRMRDGSSLRKPAYVELHGMPRDNSDLEFLAIIAAELCLEVRGVDQIREVVVGDGG
ncbi:MAG: hypothetical protein JSR99_13720 [Proteobacteria bacterium]|nr:hypothetical protein [Pseudomonadota bacterium]